MIARNVELVTQLRSGRLDLAIAWHAGNDTPHMETMGSYPLRWIGPANPSFGHWLERNQPVPLIAFDAPCLVRTIATEALDRAGIPWRLVFTSPSLSGIWAAVAAGLGVTVRTEVGMTPSLRLLHPEECGLPALPALGLALHRAEAQPATACRRLQEIIRESISSLHGRLQ
jgi:DNA-binding transcriptional LysR family regulator